jgi:hypothetical protein
MMTTGPQCRVDWDRQKNEVSLVFMLKDAYACAVQYKTLLEAMQKGTVEITLETRKRKTGAHAHE